MFYRWLKNMQTVGPDRDLNLVAVISVGDLMGKRLGMEGLMVQVLGGTSPDPWGPMESEEPVVQK